MNTTSGGETILKQDVLGRVKTPKARREELLDEFERSGLPGVKFAELVGIKYQTFATWAQKRRRKCGTYPATKVPAPTAKVRWLEALVEPARSSGSSGQPGLVLHLPDGARVEISDVKQVELAAALVRALQSPGGRPPC